MNWQKSVEELGYAIIPEVLNSAELRALSGQFSQAALPRSRAGVRHAMKLPAVNELARDPKLVGMAREVLGDGAIPFRATLFDKSAGANWLVVWHQDTALPLRAKLDVPDWGPWSIKEGVHYAHAPTRALSHVLALRVHLDDSTSQNGPLRVLPGTHKLGVLSDEAVHEWALQAVPVDCPVPKGGVLAMRPLTIHASSKSQSPRPRRVLHIEYAASLDIGDGLSLAVA